MMVIHIKGTQHTSKPAIRRDFAHTPTVIDLLSSDDEVDCSALNEECERSAEVETVDGCVVCDQDFTSFSEESKEIHINKCLTSQSRYDALVSGSTSSETVALNGKTFFCVLCDVDLSRRKILSRCWHLKRCMRSKGMDTKTLMQLVSPIDSATDDSESEIEEIAEPVANSSSTRNAWTVLMSSAKQQSQLKGFHATPSTSIKNAEPALLPKKRALPDKENVDNKISKKKFSKPAKAPTEQSGYAPSFKKIQLGSMAVPIVVDGFQYACSALSSCYFLTHFHSDHYQGLSKDFDSGMIYCSKITANLVKAKLRVSISHLTGLDLETKYVLSVGGQDVKVTLIDANHCPGSVCILFYFPSTRRYVLHTGDFRYDSSTMLRTSPTLRQLVTPPPLL